SSFTGTIKELAANEGDTIQVGELMCYIETEEETDTSNSTSKPDNENKEDKKTATEDVSNREDQSMKKRYSPAVLRLAQENDIDLEQLTGTGRGGRITRKDIEKHITSGASSKTGQTTDMVQSEEPASNKTEQQYKYSAPDVYETYTDVVMSSAR